jgi:DNA-binding PadR family transcriptional regulator
MAETTVNPTAAALLGLLHDGPMTGGQLMAAAQKRLGSYWTMTRSQVYRELPALATAGYVKLGKPGPRSSQPYTITPAGKRAFTRWLGEEPGRDAVRNSLALRVAFGKHQSASQLKTAFDQAATYHNTALNEAREAVKELKKEGDEHAAAAQEFAIGYHRAALAWLKSAPAS